MLTTLIATAIVLGVLIFVHELGHFMTAKLVDIEVPRFSIGFGPRVIGFKRGETEYVISLLPLGGYVKMAGMEEMETIEGGPEKAEDGTPRPRPTEGRRSPSPRDFESKSLPARTLVISAGVIMNLLFAFVVFSVIALVWGIPAEPPALVGSVVEETLPEGAHALADVPHGTRITAIGGARIDSFEDIRMTIATARAGEATVEFEGAPPIQIEIPGRDSLKAALLASLEPVAEIEPVLSDVVDGEPAAQAGMRAGDRIIGAAGQPIRSWQEFVSAIEAHPGQPLPVTVARGGDTVELTVTPSVNRLGERRVYGRIGVRSTAAPPPREHVGPTHAVVWGAQETVRWVRLTVDFVIGLFGGRHSPRSVGGPGTIAQISGEAARAGLETFLNFMALLSVNLAVLNLLPIPVLDGGHLVFLAVEAVRGRALSFEQRMRLSQVGFVIILAIMAFAIGNDLLRWIGL